MYSPQEYKDILESVVCFVYDLWPIFGNEKKDSSLRKYKLAVTDERVSKDTEKIDKVIAGYKTFFEYHLESIKNRNLEGKFTIKYGTSQDIKLDIGFFLGKSDTETQDAIYKHLLYIAYMIETDKEKRTMLLNLVENFKSRSSEAFDINSLLGIPTDTKEGKFFNDMLGGLTKNINPNDPMSFFSGLMDGSFMKNMTDTIGNEQFDIGNVTSLLTGVLTNITKNISQNNNAEPTSLHQDDVIPQLENESTTIEDVTDELSKDTSN